jgi:hypothetical protein
VLAAEHLQLDLHAVDAPREREHARLRLDHLGGERAPELKLFAA